MKNKNLLPLALFCIVFLAYSIYFVKVINTADRLEPNSIAKNIKRVIEEREMEKNELEGKNIVLSPESILKEPLTRYVNYTWLNVRSEPSLGSAVVEKILQNDGVQVLGYPSSSWAYVKTKSGTKGYVARRYLSDKPTPGAEKPAVAVTTPAVPTPPAPVSKPVVESKPVAVAEPASKEIFEVPIITYHHILDNVGQYSDSTALPEVNFIAQLDYLAGNGFKTYTFYDLKAIAEGKMPAVEKAVILTFNGGFADAYKAAQHLNGKGLKGVFYITTSKVGTEGYLDWRQVKKMREWGMEIGSQGVNGANLAQSTDFYITDEAVRSKEIIEKELGEKIVSFAYAFGGFNQKVMDAVKAAGYSFARTNQSGSQYSEKQFYMLPTLRVFNPAGANQFRTWLGE